MSIIIIRTYVLSTPHDLQKKVNLFHRGEPEPFAKSGKLVRLSIALFLLLKSLLAQTCLCTAGFGKEVLFQLDNKAFICGGCGNRLREPSESNGRFVCPECGCDGLADARVCSVCGEILPESEFEDGDGELCGNCRRAAQHFFRLFLGKWFTRAEVNYLNKVYEGRDLGEGIERFGTV